MRLSTSTRRQRKRPQPVIEHTFRHTLPAAYALLPPRMTSPAASAMLLSIGLQESRFRVRRQQPGGPARGFWQFEPGGIVGVLQHPQTEALIDHALRQLCYTEALGDVRACHAIVEHNDTVACVFARLLLWTLPDPLPDVTNPLKGYDQYLEGWRPGKPHPATWAGFYLEAWDLVLRPPTTGVV